jgi:hypothetical protein
MRFHVTHEYIEFFVSIFSLENKNKKMIVCIEMVDLNEVQSQGGETPVGMDQLVPQPSHSIMPQG